MTENVAQSSENVLETLNPDNKKLENRIDGIASYENASYTFEHDVLDKNTKHSLENTLSPEHTLEATNIESNSILADDNQLRCSLSVLSRNVNVLEKISDMSSLNVYDDSAFSSKFSAEKSLNCDLNPSVNPSDNTSSSSNTATEDLSVHTQNIGNTQWFALYWCCIVRVFCILRHLTLSF